MLLVVDEGTFKRIAAHSDVNGEVVYTASFSMDSSRSHWRPYLVRREELANRLMGPPRPTPLRQWPEGLEREPMNDYSRWLGFVSEIESEVTVVIDAHTRRRRHHRTPYLSGRAGPCTSPGCDAADPSAAGGAIGQAAGAHLARCTMRDRPPARSTAAAQPKMAQRPSALSACSAPVSERPATT
jgi:hypothetical protein